MFKKKDVIKDTQFNVCISKELSDEISNYCTDNHLSKSVLVEKAFDFFKLNGNELLQKDDVVELIKLTFEIIYNDTSDEDEQFAKDLIKNYFKYGRDTTKEKMKLPQ